jgi:hypothetical protein
MITEGLFVLGTGEADQPDRERLGASVRQAVRFADSAAWVVACAIERALEEFPDRDRVDRESACVLVISERGPVETMAAVAQAALEGYSSPMRYPASNPGSLAGVSCIAFGFRGGALNFTMPASEGVDVSLLTAGAWLRDGVASMAAIAVCTLTALGNPTARALLVSGDQQASSGPLGSQHVAWLSGD